MASDDMKKMLMLIESCSCESNKEDTDEVTEGGTPLSGLTHRYVDNPTHPAYKSGSNTEPEKSKTLQDIIKNNDFNGLQVWAMDNKNSPLVKGASAAADDAENSIKQELGLVGKLPYEIPASVMSGKINPARTAAMFDYLKAHATEGEEQINELGGNNYGSKIKKYFGKIGDHGDDGYEYLDKNAPVWAGLWEKYDGDIDVIINSESAEVLRQAAKELNGVVSDLESGMSESFDLDAFMESIREIVGGQLDELTPDVYRGAADGRRAQSNMLKKIGKSYSADIAASSSIDLTRTADRRERDQAVNQQLAGMSPAAMRKMGLTKQFTKADGQVVEDEQLDELSPDTYYSASKAREAQKIALAKKMGVGSFHMDDNDAPAPLRALSAAQNKLRNTFNRRKSDNDDLDQQVAAVQGMSPATVRKLGMTPTKKFTKADKTKVTDMRPNRPTAPAVTEYDATKKGDKSGQLPPYKTPKSKAEQLPPYKSPPKDTSNQMEDVSTTKKSTNEKMADELFAANPNMTPDDLLDKAFEIMKARHGKNAAEGWFRGPDNSDELVTMYNQLKREASKSTVESDDAEFQSFMETLSNVLRHK